MLVHTEDHSLEKELITSRIKATDAAVRGYLAKLALHAYNRYIENKESLFDLNTKQAEKYRRFAFSLDPNNLTQDVLNQVFPRTAEQVLVALKTAHPFGVQIWVNPDDANHAPLLEHNFTLAGQSILSGARMLLQDMKTQQYRLKKNDDYVTNKYDLVLKKIQNEYQDFILEIEKFYDYKFGQEQLEAAKTKSQAQAQFNKAQQILQAFQSRIIYHLTSFEIPPAQHQQADYQCNYKRLAIYEQRQKTRNLYKNQPLLDDKEGDVFNRDIFTLDIEKVVAIEANKNPYDDNDDDKAPISAKNPYRFHFHQRHYTLTAEQLRLMLIENRLILPPEPVKGVGNNYQDPVPNTANSVESKVNLYTPQPTETAHSPGYGLANYALVEEGNYDPNSENTKISSLHVRHGSAAPNEAYAGKLKKLDRHETTYRTYLNMMQNLQALRVKVIESILKKDVPTLSPVLIAQLSHTLAYEITECIRKRHWGHLNTIINGIIDKTFTAVQIRMQVKDAISKNDAEEIIYVQNFYTHLITPTGMGSLSEGQRLQYKDSRIAQYMTRNEGKMSYMYMSNGVNSMRYDTRTFDAWHQKLEGNNCTALIEFYKTLQATYPLDLGVSATDISAYDKKLTAVEKSARAYFIKIENEYINTKFNIENKQIRLAAIKVELVTKNLANVDPVKFKTLNSNHQSILREIFTLKRSFKEQGKILNKLKGEFKTAEIALHVDAKKLNAKIYEALKENQNIIDALASDPNTRGKYLAYKGFALAQDLFNKTQNGVTKWKLQQYNGVMQALLHLSAEQIGMFGSYGCKSANDRAFLLALLISELSKLDSNQALDEEYLSNLQKNAQRSYAGHISRDQTGLDRSAIPKTGKDILPHASKNEKSFGYSEFNMHRQFGDIAAHKRVKMPVKFEQHLQPIPYYHLKTQLDNIADKEFVANIGDFKRYRIVQEGVKHLRDNSYESSPNNKDAFRQIHVALHHLVNTFTVKFQASAKTRHQLKAMEIEIDKNLGGTLPADDNVIIEINQIKQAMTKFVLEKKEAPLVEIAELCTQQHLSGVEFYSRTRQIFEEYRYSSNFLKYTFFEDSKLKTLCQSFIETNLMQTTQGSNDINFNHPGLDALLTKLQELQPANTQTKTNAQSSGN